MTSAFTVDSKWQDMADTQLKIVCLNDSVSRSAVPEEAVQKVGSANPRVSQSNMECMAATETVHSDFDVQY